MPILRFGGALPLVAFLAAQGAALAAPPVPGASAPPAPSPKASAFRPPSEGEQKAFAEGLRLYESGDARGAERVWKAGYALGRDPAFLIRIAEAQEKAGAPQEAAQTYELYLRESPQGADRGEIEARANRLNPRRQAAGEPAVDEADVPGEMKGAPTTAPHVNAEAPAGLAPPSAAGPPAGSPAAPVHASPAAVQARDDSLQDLMPLIEDEPPRSRLNTAAWIGAGVTTLLLGVAAFYGASAAEKSGDANRLLTYADEKTGLPQEYASRAAQFEEDVRVGRRDDRLAKGFAIVAAAGAVTSAVLFIVDGARAKPESASQQARRDPAATGAPRIAPRLFALPGSTPQVALAWSF